MKSTFKEDKLGRINPAVDGHLHVPSKRFSLRPKRSMTRSKSLKPYAIINSVLANQEKTEK